MGLVRIREYNDMARPRAGGANVGTGLLKGPIVTDELGLPIKTVNTSPGTSVDCAQLTRKTHFVALEADADVRYAVRPKALIRQSLAATENHPLIPAGATVIEAVYPQAIIAFLQTSQSGGATVPFQQSYIPVLAL